MQSFLIQKKKLIIEILVLVVFLGGMYYLYTMFTAPQEVVETKMNEQLLGQNFVLFLKVINQDRLSFRNDFMKASLVSQLRDFSETITENPSRGRADPFVPYASSRPLR
jgi:hypothetical protein